METTTSKKDLQIGAENQAKEKESKNYTLDNIPISKKREEFTKASQVDDRKKIFWKDRLERFDKTLSAIDLSKKGKSSNEKTNMSFSFKNKEQP